MVNRLGMNSRVAAEARTATFLAYSLPAEHITRIAPVRNRRLCHELPHRWHRTVSGELCLRCSRYQPDPIRSDPKWRGARHPLHR